MGSVQVEVATTYRAGGRRYLTKSAAFRAAARAKIRERCECEPADDDPRGPGPVTCYYHEDAIRYERLIRTLAYFHGAAYRRAEQ